MTAEITAIEQQELISVQETFGNTLVELGEDNEDIVVCEADLMKASGSRPFMEKFPERHFNFGIAEQNMIAAAAGIALSGKTVFASTFANFISKRACDHVSIAVAYNMSNVKVCGDYAGLSSGKNGGTHSSVQDIAIMRAMPNMRVAAPADTTELAAVMRAITAYDGPVYLRKTRGPMKRIFEDGLIFTFGRAVEISSGDDITIISTGQMTAFALDAVRELEMKGVKATLVHMSSIKPLDIDAILKAAERTGSVITVENHNIIGGLGSAVAEVLAESGIHPKFKRMGISDRFGETATFEWLLDKHGISAPHIVEEVRTFLR